jgi:hypothetical protein
VRLSFPEDETPKSATTSSRVVSGTRPDAGISPFA